MTSFVTFGPPLAKYVSLSLGEMLGSTVVLRIWIFVFRPWSPEQIFLGYRCAGSPKAPALNTSLCESFAVRSINVSTLGMLVGTYCGNILLKPMYWVQKSC